MKSIYEKKPVCVAWNYCITRRTARKLEALTDVKKKITTGHSARHLNGNQDGKSWWSRVNLVETWIWDSKGQVCDSCIRRKTTRNFTAVVHWSNRLNVNTHFRSKLLWPAENKWPRGNRIQHHQLDSREAQSFRLKPCSVQQATNRMSLNGNFADVWVWPISSTLARPYNSRGGKSVQSKPLIPVPDEPSLVIQPPKFYLSEFQYSPAFQTHFQNTMQEIQTTQKTKQKI